MVNCEGCVNLTVWQTFHNIPVHQIITLYTYTMLCQFYSIKLEKKSHQRSGVGPECCFIVNCYLSHYIRYKFNILAYHIWFFLATSFLKPLLYSGFTPPLYTVVPEIKSYFFLKSTITKRPRLNSQLLGRHFSRHISFVTCRIKRHTWKLEFPSLKILS